MPRQTTKEVRYLRIENDGSWFLAVVRDEGWHCIQRGALRFHATSAAHDADTIAMQQQLNGYDVVRKY